MNDELKDKNDSEKELTYEKIGREAPYNFFEDPKVKIYRIVGCNMSIKSVRYGLYVGWIFICLLYMITITMLTIIWFRQHKLLWMNVAHMGILYVFCLLANTFRHMSEKELTEMSALFRRGIYLYDEIPADDQSDKILRDMKKKIQLIIKYFIPVMNACLFQAAIGLFLVRRLFSEEIWVDDGVNPFLQEPVYMPFSTRGYVGFTFGFIINVMGLFSIVVVIINSFGNYVTIIMNLVAEYKVLNHMLRTLDIRAYAEYTKGRSEIKRPIPQYLYSESEFQKCIYQCLVRSLKHHHTIIKFMKDLNFYISGCVTNTMLITTALYAINIIILLEDKQRHTSLAFTTFLVAEIMYNFIVCYLGELITIESENLFFALYETPWYYCDKDFRVILDVMMSNTKKPTKLYCLGFKISASIEVYGDILSAMYKLINILR
nr:olfactory receptor 76 [Tropidothorax elegans]